MKQVAPPFSAFHRLIAALLVPAFVLTSAPVPLRAANVEEPAGIAVPLSIPPSGPVPDAALLRAQEAALAVPLSTPLPAPVARLPIPVPPLLSAAEQLRSLNGSVHGLVPLGATNTTEDEELLGTLQDREVTQSIEAFLKRNPNSPWSASLLNELGRRFAVEGRFTRSLAGYKAALQLARQERKEANKTIADAAIAALAEAFTRTRSHAEMDELRASLGGWPLGISAAEALRGAQGTMGRAEQKRTKAAQCGERAVLEIQRAIRRIRSRGAIDNASYDRMPEERLRAAFEADSPRGLSLVRLQQAAKNAGVQMRSLRRLDAAARLPVPSIMHWKWGHYSAVVAASDRSFTIRDPQLGGLRTFSVAALAEEASSYILSAGEMPLEGWTEAKPAEIDTVFGALISPSTTYYPTQPPPCGPSTGNSCGSCPHMAGYSIALAQASLTLRDTPVGYTPAVGPDLQFTMTYEHRAKVQPDVANVGTLGRQWTFDWLSWVEPEWTEPGRVQYPPALIIGSTTIQAKFPFAVRTIGGGTELHWPKTRVVYRPGGGTTQFIAEGPSADFRLGRDVVIEAAEPVGIDSVTFPLDGYPHESSRAKLTRVSETPGTTGYSQFKRELPDGSVEYFERVIGARVMLTRIVYPGGHQVTMVYDGAAGGPGRLRKVIDAGGLATFIYYSDVVGGDPAIAQPAITIPASGANNTRKIVAVRDPFGRVASFGYDSTGRLIRSTDTAGMSSQFVYGAGDFITKLTTPYGDTNFDSDTNHPGNPLANPPIPPADPGVLWVEVTTPLGARERVETVVQRGFASATEPPPPELGSGTGELDYLLTHHWDQRSLVGVAAADPLPADAATVYHWRAIAETQELVPSLGWSKKPLESRVWYRMPGQTNYDTFTGVMNPEAIGRALDDGTAQVRQFLYEGDSSRLAQTTDPKGRITKYEYAGLSGSYAGTAGKSARQITAVKQKNGAGWDTLTQFGAYDATWEKPLSVTDAAGQVTTSRYTAFGQVDFVDRVRVVNGATETERVKYVYELLSAAPGFRRVKQIRRQRFNEGVPGNASATPVQDVAVNTFTFDTAGRVATATNADNYTVTYAYDVFDRVVKTTYPDGTYEQTIYNRLDAEWQRDRAGRWTHILHDAGRQVTSVTDPAGRTTSFNNCECGALEAIIDANGNPTSFEYDVQGRVTRKIYADATALTYTYEGTTSRLLSVLDAKGQRTNYSYEVDDSLKTVSYTNATWMPLSPPTPTVTYTYDAIYRRLTRLVDGTGTTTFTYRPLAQLGAGKLSQENGPEPVANGVDPDLIAHTYDEYGRETGCTVGGVGTTGRGFDFLGRFAQETNALGTTSAAYAGSSGRVTQMTYPNNQTSSYGYDPLVAPAGTGDGDLRLASIQHSANGTVFSRHNYKYSVAGNIVQWMQSLQAATNYSDKVWSYAYDAADQLIGATEQNQYYLSSGPTGPSTQQARYDYDRAGNRKTEQRVVPAQGSTPASTTLGADTHNSLNQLTARNGGSGKMVFEGTVTEPANVSVGGAPAQVWGIANNQYGYRGTATVQNGANNVPISATDANGNVRNSTAHVTVTSTGTTAFSYDLNGNLLSDGMWTYSWDAANRLTKASRTNEVWEWTYNGRGQRVEEKLNSVVQWRLRWCGLELKVMAKPDGSDTRRFFAQGLQRTTVVSGQPTTLAYLLLRDHLGSVREMTNSSGTLMKRYAYDPWGRRTETANGAGSFDPLIGFTGHYFHAATGLHFAFYRAYSAELGRWLNRDPIKNPELLPEGPNIYSYVAGNPVRYNDPTGQYLCLILYCMRKVDNMQITGTDAYLHCRTSCELARCLSKLQPNIFGAALANAMGIVHELWQGDNTVERALADLVSNYIGIRGFLDAKSCEDACAPLVGINNP